MSVIYSYNFDKPSGQPFTLAPDGWTLALSGTPSIGTVLGGCGFGNGVGATGKRFIACQSGQATHTFSNTSTVSLRAICAFKAASSIWEAFLLWAPSGALNGFTFVPIFKPNGSISIRMNNVQSETLSPSATGQF